MDPLTHAVAGVAISQFVPAPSRGWAALAGIFFAILPDLDYVMIFSSRLAYLKHHRGLTHSLAAMVFFVFLFAGLGRLLGGPRWFRPLVIIGFLVLGSHLLLDWTTSYGTQLLLPFSRAKLSLDWVFIIDPYLTGLLLVAAIAVYWSPGWGRTLGAACLALAGMYILLCGFYQQQALNLARQVYKPQAEAGATLAALPQPLSPRRWLLVAAAPGEVRQAFVELSYWPMGKNMAPPPEIRLQPVSQGRFQAPPAAFRPPDALEVYLWQAAPSPTLALSPEIQGVLATYMEFSRFPLLVANDQHFNGKTLTWLDLRFSLPGRRIPFVLQVQMDQGGRLTAWHIGGGVLPSPKSSLRPG
ncbi:MAG: metal-dependent hydrolase [Desulfobaccales bacterium]